MKATIVLIIVNLAVLVIGLGSRFWEFSSDGYISEEVLDLSTPFDVKIDVDFLESLEPAYEQ